MAKRPPRTDDLNGPHPEPQPLVPLDLGLSPAKAADLLLQVKQLLYRWKPMTDDPNSLGRDVYRLIAWVLEEEPPTCKLLVGPDPMERQPGED